MQTDKDRWIASMRQEIDAMNKAFYATYAKEELAAQCPEIGYNGTVPSDTDYDDTLEWHADWIDESRDGTSHEHITAARSVGDDKLATLITEWERLSGEIGAHCRKKLEERAKPSTMQKLDAFVKAAVFGLDRSGRGNHAVCGPDAIARKAYGIPPAAERTCSTCSKPNDVSTYSTRAHAVGDWVRRTTDNGVVQPKTLGRVVSIEPNGLRIKWETENSDFLYDIPDHESRFETLAVGKHERICATCSKTCDVGVKCWWCGELG